MDNERIVDWLLDGGEVFTGDLTNPAHFVAEDPDAASASWRLLREKGARRVHPGHGPIYSIDARLGVDR